MRTTLDACAANFGMHHAARTQGQGGSTMNERLVVQIQPHFERTTRGDLDVTRGKTAGTNQNNITQKLFRSCPKKIRNVEFLFHFLGFLGHKFETAFSVNYRISKFPK